MEKTSGTAKLLEKAYALGFDYEKRYRGCGQCTLAAVQETLDMVDEAVFQATTGFAGGVALLGDGICGAYAAGVLFFGQISGRDRFHFADPEKRIRSNCYKPIQKLHDRFIQEYGAVCCRDIQAKIFGRSYDLRDPDQRAKFEDAGAHTSKCLDAVGKAARWTVEIAVEEGYVKSTE
jgi:C_GCAxxG_C_C family probable redox protein